MLKSFFFVSWLKSRKPCLIRFIDFSGLRNPVRVAIKEKSCTNELASDGEDTSSEQIQKTPATLTNYYMIVDANEKFNQLMNFLQAHKKEKIMLFVSTCAGVDYFSKILPPLLKYSQVQYKSTIWSCHRRHHLDM